MATLDDFFKQPQEALHPRLRGWKARLADPGVSATLEIFRPESEVGLSQAELSMQFTKDGNPLPSETVLWSDDLNAGLIQLGVRAESEIQEAMRFSLGLRAAFRSAEREFGDGYFNGVLIELLGDSDLNRYEAIASVLKHAHVNSPLRDGKAAERYAMCRELIAAGIRGRAMELVESLRYSQEEAKQILIAAMARYLDERFSVTSRRRHGLL